MPDTHNPRSASSPSNPSEHPPTHTSQTADVITAASTSPILADTTTSTPTQNPDLDPTTDPDLDPDPDIDPTLDPSLAALLGFTSFGTQPSRKRKHANVDAAVIDLPPRPAGMGANALPLGTRRRQAVADSATSAGVAGAQSREGAGGQADTTPQTGTGAGDAAVAGEEGAGARGEEGFFSPSFVEDPWRALRERRGEKGGVAV